MKKNTFIMLTLIILLGFSCINIYVYKGKINIHHKMEVYLKDKGYKDSEVRSIEVKHSFMSAALSYNEWGVCIIYNDEPNSRYYYDYKNGSISPCGISGFTEDSVYKHGDPKPINK